jgi:signal transduction histidine kinase
MEKKRPFWQVVVYEFEHFTDHIIPVLVVLIAIALVLENPFWTLVHLSEYEPWTSIFDGVIVFFFVVDLVFKWFKTRNVRRFFRLYWIDIIAVFPFYLLFRAYSELTAVFRVGEEVSEVGQKVAHEAVLLREASMLREAEEAAKEARIAKETKVVGRGIRGVQRFLRVMKGRLYTSHRALVAIHQEHERDHKAGY